MKKAFAVAAALALLGSSIAAQADVFNLGTGFTNLETVAVGNPGNAADTRYETPGYGSVGYTYNIGKYEVTAKQYTDFLNNRAKCDGDPYGLYDTAMGDLSGSLGCNIQRSGGGTVADPYVYTVADDWANRPVNWVSYWDACRFANWLGNGQGNGDTETGAYTLNNYNGPDGRTIQRNAGWKWAVTSEDEWYKAAYYKGGGADAGYWDYPTQSDSVPSNDLVDPDTGNNANFGHIDQEGRPTGGPYYRTNVREFENSASAHGTFDQGGNVWEWNEAVVYQDSSHADRGMRGGSFCNSAVDSLRASSRYGDYPTGQYYAYIGFRVSEVPEPASIVALAGAFGSLLAFRRRKV